MALARKLEHAKSLAASFRYNSRNLESPWYGLWTAVLTQLVDELDDFLVIPQYTLWFSDYVDDGTPDELDLLSGDIDIEADQEQAGSDHDVQSDITTSSMRSFADGNTESKIPDFVILHLCSQPIHDHHARLGSRRIKHERCAVVIEEKHGPKRSIDEEAFDTNLEDCIQVALDDLGDQCYCLFRKHPSLKSTIAIAASGNWWTFHEVLKNQAPTAWGDTLDTEAWDVFTTTWPAPVQIGSEESDERFKHILHLLEDIPDEPDLP